jgi:tetratricopeptide (TPR) repeat protein
LAQIDSIKKLTPTSYKPYADLGNYNYSKNYNYNAIPEYLKAIELGYPDDDVWHSVGTCYYKIEKYREALPYLKHSISPIENPITLSTIAECYSKLDKNDSALLYYEKAYKLIMPDPSFLESYYEYKAKKQLAEEKYDEAISSYYKFIMQTEGLQWEIHYKNSALEKIAAIYIEIKKEPTKALELYKKILAQTSEYKTPNLFKYYEQRVTKLNEEIFFKAE